MSEKILLLKMYTKGEGGDADTAGGGPWKPALQGRPETDNPEAPFLPPY